MMENSKTPDFFLDDEACGQSFHGQTVTCSYAALVRVLGEPNSDGDAYKVSTEWDIRGKDGREYSVYDWKSTDLYDEEHLPTVEVSRLEPNATWHIGSDGRDSVFLNWLRGRLAGYR